MENVVRNKKVQQNIDKFNVVVEDANESIEEVVDRARFEPWQQSLSTKIYLNSG